MPGFDISIPTNKVVLDESRRGEASFTVTNETGHPVRVRTSPVALAPTDARWLTLAGPVERDAPTGGTLQVVVVATVPADVPGGDYPFRLDVLSVTLPDEEWAQGPVVAFHLPDVPPPPPPPPPEEPPGYVETALGAVIGGLVLAALAFGLAFLVGSITDNALAGFFIGLFLGVIGLWLGAVAGAGIALRLRGFDDPWRTWAPMVLLVPLIGGPVLFGTLSITGNLDLDLPDAIGFVFAFIVVVIALALPAVAARAFARWRKTGHL